MESSTHINKNLPELPNCHIILLTKHIIINSKLKLQGTHCNDAIKHKQNISFAVTRHILVGL